MYALRNEDGYACCESGDEGEKIVLLFWSNKARAARVRDEVFMNYNIARIELSDFIFNHLPEMDNDGVLADPDFTHDLVGSEIEPASLRDEIIDAMPREIYLPYSHLQTVPELP